MTTSQWFKDEYLKSFSDIDAVPDWCVSVYWAVGETFRNPSWMDDEFIRGEVWNRGSGRWGGQDYAAGRGACVSGWVALVQDEEGAGSMTSPYALIGAKLVDNGYHAIPVKPGSKPPGIYLFKQWRGTTDWTRYCDRLPTETETDIWNQWPDAGVCVAMDHRLKVIDIDTDDPALMAAVIDTLPDSPVKKRGRKGFSGFYRGEPEIQSAPFSVARSAIETVRVLDLLAYGRQTVLPPTTHPDTDGPYEWLTSDTLVDTPLEQLPVLPADITELLSEALKPFGYEPPTAPLRRGDGDSYWRDLNSTALLNLDRWVPALSLPKTHRTQGGYRAVTAWRGVDNANLSFHPSGIRDWGEDKPYTPIDVVVASLCCDVAAAADWLEQRLGIADTFDVDAFIKKVRKAA